MAFNMVESAWRLYDARRLAFLTMSQLEITVVCHVQTAVLTTSMPGIGKQSVFHCSPEHVGQVKPT